MAGNGFESTVRARRVASELRAVRLDGNVPVAALATVLGWDVEDYVAAEECRAAFPPATVRAVLADQDGDPDYIDWFAELAAGCAKHDWVWHALDPAPPFARMFAGLVRFACHAMIYHPLLVPPVLQTWSYGQALRQFSCRVDRTVMADAFETQMAGQERIDAGTDPMRLTVIVGEGAFRSMAGTGAVMAEQIDHVVELIGRPHINIRVLPMDRGELAGMSQPFTILQYPETPDADIAHVEHPTRAMFIDQPNELDVFHLSFQRLQSAACDSEHTRLTLAALKHLVDY